MTGRRTPPSVYVDLVRPRITLGEQVRGEARRRGGVFAAHADEYMALAERWYGRCPCKGEELRIVFAEVFGLKLEKTRT